MKVAVVGCGAIGSRYIGWARDLGADVAACDTSPDRREWLEHTAPGPIFAHVADVLDWAPDRMIVATPPHHHEIGSLAAMAAGVPVLVEKPLAHNLEAARRIVAAAESHGAPAWVVCNMRFHKGIETLKTNLDMVGRPLAFRAVFGHRLSQMRTAGGDFAREANMGGGVVLDCIHEFDYLRWLFGPIAKIRSTVAQIGDDVIKAEDLAQVTLTFESGVHGSLHLDFLMRQKRRGLEVFGTDGNLIWLSTGRMPENCRVSFGDQNGDTLLLDEADLDTQAGYMCMLDHFLADGAGLQTLDEAMAALEAALIARNGT